MDTTHETKFLIVGRTASGKDALKNILTSKYGWTFVKSYTTRPRRTDSEDTHIFISKTEADQVPDTDRAAYTEINGCEYFATNEQVRDCMAYIIDPTGLYMLMRNMPDTDFIVVYMMPKDREIQKEKALKRSDDADHEMLVFEARSESEQDQFDRFEQVLKSEKKPFQNWKNTILFTNHYNEDEMEELAEKLEQMSFSRGC